MSIDEYVEDGYVIRIAREPVLTKEESAQKYSALIRDAEYIQQENGTGKFNITRRYEFIPAIAAVIKDKGLVELFIEKGYAVEKQPKIDISKPDS